MDQQPLYAHKGQLLVEHLTEVGQFAEEFASNLMRVNTARHPDCCTTWERPRSSFRSGLIVTTKIRSSRRSHTPIMARLWRLNVKHGRLHSQSMAIMRGCMIGVM